MEARYACPACRSFASDERIESEEKTRERKHISQIGIDDGFTP